MASFSQESANLEVDGPVIEVSVGLVKTARDALIAAGQTVPAPIKVSALVDTGAQSSVVQAGILAPLGLHAVGVTPVNTATSNNVNCALYAVELTLPNGYLDMTVIEAPLVGQNIQALIGRDVLKFGILIYQGHSSQFTLSF